MKVYVSEKDRNKPLTQLSNDVYSALMNAKINRLNEIQSMPIHRQSFFNTEVTQMDRARKVSDLEDCLNIVYMTGKLLFFTFNNLRCQQDGVSSEVKRFDTLQEAVREYNSLPKNYTTALGAYLSETNCIDFVHRRNGESVLVTDYRNMNDWVNNGLVRQAIDELIGQLGIEYESDLKSLGTDCPILVPVSKQDEINSYFKDKYLYPKSSNHLLTAVNEVFEEGEGWINFEDFFHKIKNISPSKETYRPKITKYNISYIDLNGRVGQADISPSDFMFLKKQTEERFYQHPKLDNQIKCAANKTIKDGDLNLKRFERENR